MKFEDKFPYDKKKYYLVILFFDNMIRRDYITILKKMKECHSGMICENIGYNLPDADDCDFIDGNYIELWQVAGNNEHSYGISFDMFVECLKISAEIWKNENSIYDKCIIDEINNYIYEIEKRYIQNIAEIGGYEAGSAYEVTRNK